MCLSIFYFMIFPAMGKIHNKIGVRQLKATISLIRYKGVALRMASTVRSGRRSFEIVITFVLATTLIFSSFVLVIEPPLQAGYAQFQNSTVPQQPTSNNASSALPNSANISITETGESRFVEPETLAASSFPAADEEIVEPENPLEAQIKNERIEAKALSEPGVSTSSLEEQVIAEFDASQVIGIDAATTQPLNQSLANSTQPLNQSLANSELSPQITTVLGFEGRSQENSGGSRPPDVTLAVGPNHIVQMVNTALQITDKVGNVLRTGTLEDFFGVSVRGNCDPCDPFVIFDPSTDRFFASVLSVPDGTVRLAVSETSDPTNIWNTFTVRFNPTGSDCPDQPYIAVSSDKLAIGSNVYSNYCGGRYLGTQHVIINKADLISQEGSSEPPTFFATRDPTGFAERPVRSFATTPDIILVGVGVGHEIDRVKMITYSGQVPNIQSSIEYVSPIRTLFYPPPASQPTINIPLDTTGRLQSAAISPDGRYIWISSMVECPIRDPDNIPRSCIRLIQFNPSTKQVLQDFDLVIRDADLLYPSLTVTASGDMVLSFGISSSNIFPSFAATRQPAGSSANTVDQPVLIKAGFSFTQLCESGTPDEPPTCRYGDYFGASIEADPLDIHNVWVTGQYLIAPNIWGTFITEVTP
jgi:hypothetical protein